MRKKIAAANWKMNLTIDEGKSLLEKITGASIEMKKNHLAIFAVPAPYLMTAEKIVSGKPGMHIAAQNCYSKMSGAYTGEISVAMLRSINIHHVIIGHSERREYFNETNQQLADKVNICLQNNITPIFCCGEPLEIRESNKENEFVEKQLQESLFHLNETEVQKVIIAYEPIWAIGTGKTASSDQAQQMHASIRTLIKNKYGNEVAENISILYGGSVKGSNAVELFSQPDVDGGLVGGSSLIAEEFITIIKSLG